MLNVSALKIAGFMTRFRAAVYVLLIADLIASFICVTYVFGGVEDVRSFWLNCVLILFGFFVLGFGWFGVGGAVISEAYEGSKRRNYVRLHIVLFFVIGVLSLVVMNVLLFVTGNGYYSHGVFACAGALFAMQKFCDRNGAFIKFHGETYEKQ